MLQRKGVSAVKKQLYNILSFIFSMFENKSRTNIEKRQKSGNSLQFKYQHSHRHESPQKHNP
jgi:hypothetical protein